MGRLLREYLANGMQAMTRYIVVCREMGPPASGCGFQHVVRVGLLDGTQVPRDQMIRLLQSPTNLAVTRDERGHEAPIYVRHCRDGRHDYLTTKPNAITQDNLDNLRTCG